MAVPLLPLSALRIGRSALAALRRPNLASLRKSLQGVLKKELKVSSLRHMQGSAHSLQPQLGHSDRALALSLLKQRTFLLGIVRVDVKVARQPSASHSGVQAASKTSLPIARGLRSLRVLAGLADACLTSYHTFDSHMSQVASSVPDRTHHSLPFGSCDCAACLVTRTPAKVHDAKRAGVLLS